MLFPTVVYLNCKLVLSARRASRRGTSKMICHLVIWSDSVDELRFVYVSISKEASTYTRAADGAHSHHINSRRVSERERVQLQNKHSPESIKRALKLPHTSSVTFCSLAKITQMFRQFIGKYLFNDFFHLLFCG